MPRRASASASASTTTGSEVLRPALRDNAPRAAAAATGSLTEHRSAIPAGCLPARAARHASPRCCRDGVVLDRTVFYPLGGGQPGDTGALRARRRTRMERRRHAQGRRGARPASTRCGRRDAFARRRGRGGARLGPPLRAHAHAQLSAPARLGAALRRDRRADREPTAAVSTSTRRKRSTSDRVTAAVNALIEANHGVAVAMDHRRRTRPAARTRADDVGTAATRRGPHPAARYRRASTCSRAAVRTSRTTGEIGRVVVTKVENKGRHNRRVYVAFA